eukprot:scaffold284991_cov27-Prasinocladus_malaysianus.AAC.1
MNWPMTPKQRTLLQQADRRATGVPCPADKEANQVVHHFGTGQDVVADCIWAAASRDRPCLCMKQEEEGTNED